MLLCPDSWFAINIVPMLTIRIWGFTIPIPITIRKRSVWAIKPIRREICSFTKNEDIPTHISKIKKNKWRESLSPKKEHLYKGRKPIKTDKLLFLELLTKVENKEITPKEAIQQLGITKAKYYRLKNEFQK